MFGNSLYYAHLDSQSVSSGMRVNVGDTIGFVGNTGNARTTPPHLHFGVTGVETTVDPYWSCTVPAARYPARGRHRDWTSDWPSGARALPSAPRAPIPSVSSAVMRQCRVASSDFYRVRLPDGATGFMGASSSPTVLSRPFPVGVILARPVANLGPSGSRHGRQRVDHVLGRFGEFALVRTAAVSPVGSEPITEP
jgi:hypothetical protein